MGCGASTSPSKVKLDEAEAKVNALKGKDGVGKDGLDEIKTLTKDLNEIFDEMASSENMDALNCIGVLSDIILDNLMSRLTSDLVKMDDYEDIIEQILAIGVSLDAVRSSKASKKLEAKLGPLRQQAAALRVKSIQDVIKGTTDIAKLSDCLKEVLKEIAIITSKPIEKKIADQILALCSGLNTAKVQKGFPGLLQSSGLSCVSTMKDLAAQLDKACDQVKASSPEATWEPMEPALDKLVVAYSHRELDRLGNQASADLQHDRFPAALEALAAMKALWPYGQDSPQRPQEIVNLKSLHDLAAKQAIEACEDSLDIDLVDISMTLDEHRKAFAGLPAAEGDTLATRVKARQEELSAAAAAAVYTDPLKELRAELDKERGQSLATMLKAIESLTGVMSKVPESDLGSVSKACDDLEAWVRDAAGKIDQPNRLERLCEFATRYDAARAKLSPPLDDAVVPLLPELQEMACASNLSAAVEELSKESGLNPTAVLEYVKSVGQYMPAAGLSAESGDKLKAVVEKTSEKVFDSHQNALASGEDAKVSGLQNFAEHFDKVVTAASGEAELVAKLTESAAAVAEPAAESAAEPATEPAAEPAAEPTAESATEPAADESAAAAESGAAAAGASEAAADEGSEAAAAAAAAAAVAAPGPSEAEVAAVKAKIEEADAELVKETGMNTNKILEVLSSMEPLWEPVADSKEIKVLLVATFGSLHRRMTTACASAASDDNEAELRSLMSFAKKVDEVQAKMGSYAPGFSQSVAQAACAQDLADAGAELNKETGMNPNLVIKNLRNLKIYCEQIGGADEPDVQELHAKLGELCSTMRSRILTSYTENPSKRGELLKFAATYDATITGLAGAGNPDLQDELSGVASDS